MQTFHPYASCHFFVPQSAKVTFSVASLPRPCLIIIPARILESIYNRQESKYPIYIVFPFSTYLEKKGRKKCTTFHPYASDHFLVPQSTKVHNTAQKQNFT